MRFPIAFWLLWWLMRALPGTARTPDENPNFADEHLFDALIVLLSNDLFHGRFSETIVWLTLCLFMSGCD
jgi:hypothetical protein